MVGRERCCRDVSRGRGRRCRRTPDCRLRARPPTAVPRPRCDAHRRPRPGRRCHRSPRRRSLDAHGSVPGCTRTDTPTAISAAAEPSPVRLVRLNMAAFPPRQLVEHNLSPVDAQWMQIISLPLVSRSLGAGVRERHARGWVRCRRWHDIGEACRPDHGRMHDGHTDWACRSGRSGATHLVWLTSGDLRAGRLPRRFVRPYELARGAQRR